MRRILALLFFIFMISSLSADIATSKELTVTAVIPEDSGVEFPENVIHMDRMYFSFDGTKEALLSTNQLDAGTLNIGMNEYRISLLYYGNQTKDYAFSLEVDTGEGWRDGNGNSIPIAARVVDASVSDDISVTESDTGSANVLIPPNGPRRGENAADIVLEWSGSPNSEPGTYTVDLDIYMYAI